MHTNNNLPDSINNSYKILVAEDNVMNQKVIQAILRKEGYEATVVSNGNEALLALEEQGFFCLILDYQMPELDGFQTLQALRNNKKLTIQHIPVIFLTAELNEETLRQIEKFGVTQMLSKPINPPKLIEVLNRLKHLPPAQTVPIDKPSTQYLYTITDGNISLMVELMEIFIEEAPGALEKMKEANQRDELPDLQKIIHKIRSNYKYLGMDAVEKLLADLENDVEKKQHSHTYKNRIQEIEGLTTNFIQALRQEIKVLQQNNNL